MANDGHPTTQFLGIKMSVAGAMIVVSSPPTYANKYERTLLKRLMQEKMCFVSIQNRCPFVALPVQSVAD